MPEKQPRGWCCPCLCPAQAPRIGRTGQESSTIPADAAMLSRAHCLCQALQIPWCWQQCGYIPAGLFPAWAVPGPHQLRAALLQSTRRIRRHQEQKKGLAAKEGGQRQSFAHPKASSRLLVEGSHKCQPDGRRQAGTTRQGTRMPAYSADTETLLGAGVSPANPCSHHQT